MKEKKQKEESTHELGQRKIENTKKEGGGKQKGRSRRREKGQKFVCSTP